MLYPLIPSTEEFGKLHGSIAVNAGVAHLDLIRQVSSDDSDSIIDALLMCYETVAFCVQQELDPKCARSVPLREIDTHAMMKREVEWQITTLHRVRGCSDFVHFATHGFDYADLALFMLATLGVPQRDG
jgi:hypothetical protein